MIRIVLAAMVAMLLGCSPGAAQVATMGTTAMSLPTVPGAIVTSPLNSPGPFSATTEPGTPDTTLAPVPLASNPTTPGTVVVCTTPFTAPTSTPVSPTVTTTMGSSTSGSVTPILPLVGQAVSSTGTIPATSPAGTAALVTCSSTPGGQTVSAATLPLSIPQVPVSPAPGTIMADATGGGGTGIDPNAVVPSPNSSACMQGVSMNLAAPATVLPANASGAAPTPGVSPVLPPGC